MSSNGKAVSPVRELRKFLTREDVIEQIGMAAASGIDPDQLVRVALATLPRNPKLADCDRASWALALQQSAELGIMPTGELGRAYLIPRYNKNTRTFEVHFQLGYRGLIELARRSPEIRNVTAELVHDGDHFEIEKGDSPRLIHKPDPFGAEGREVVGAYAIAWWENGEIQFEWMTRGQIDAIAKLSESYGKGGPWDNHYGEMARKTVLRRIVKFLPLQVDVERFVSLDDAGEFPQFQRRPRRSEEDEAALEALNRAVGALPPEEDVPEGVDPDTGEIEEDVPEQPELV